MAWHFDHRASSYHTRGDERGNRILPETSLDDHRNPEFEAEPFYWVPKRAVEERLSEKGILSNFILGWRDVTTGVAERTMVPCLIPRCGAGDTFLIAYPNQTVELVCCLYAEWASLIFDYVTRQKISYVHLKFNIVKQLPTISPEFFKGPRTSFVVSRVLELTYTSNSMRPFAKELGCSTSPFAWDETRRAQLQADLDAFYARAYGLTRDELRYILDPSDLKGPHYPSETFRVLKEKEIRQYGEYRTRRLVIEAWDCMEANGEFTAMGM
jgi:hypothetical protein